MILGSVTLQKREPKGIKEEGDPRTRLSPSYLGAETGTHSRGRCPRTGKRQASREGKKRRRATNMFEELRKHVHKGKVEKNKGSFASTCIGWTSRQGRKGRRGRGGGEVRGGDPGHDGTFKKVSLKAGGKEERSVALECHLERSMPKKWERTLN